jgi:adenylosuccinate lyase
VVAIARLLREQPALALDAMMHEHERDMSAWEMEWAFVPETFILLSGALEHSCRIVEGLSVDQDRMRQNLAISGGLINSEAVMMRLAEAVGRSQAKELVTAASKKAMRSGQSFADVLAAEPEIARHLSAGDIAKLLEPDSYLGEAAAAVDRVLRLVGSQHE